MTRGIQKAPPTKFPPTMRVGSESVRLERSDGVIGAAVGGRATPVFQKDTGSEDEEAATGPSVTMSRSTSRNVAQEKLFQEERLRMLRCDKFFQTRAVQGQTDHITLKVLLVLETIRTSAMRVIHITVMTNETQRLRIKFVLYCLICAFKHKQIYLSICQQVDDLGSN